MTKRVHACEGCVLKGDTGDEKRNEYLGFVSVREIRYSIGNPALKIEAMAGQKRHRGCLTCKATFISRLERPGKAVEIERARAEAFRGRVIGENADAELQQRKRRDRGARAIKAFARGIESRLPIDARIGRGKARKFTIESDERGVLEAGKKLWKHRVKVVTRYFGDML